MAPSPILLAPSLAHRAPKDVTAAHQVSRQRTVPDLAPPERILLQVGPSAAGATWENTAKPRPNRAPIVHNTRPPSAKEQPSVFAFPAW